MPDSKTHIDFEMIDGALYDSTNFIGVILFLCHAGCVETYIMLLQVYVILFFLAVLRGLLQSLYVVINIADNPLEFVNNNIYNITDIENPKEAGFIVVVGSKYA